MTHTLPLVRSGIRFALIGAAALSLSGCISFGPKPPPTLMTLHAVSAVAPGTAITTDDHRSIAVSVPTAEPTLATQRVMVQAGPQSVAYLKNAMWASSPALLMRHLLAETITAKTGRIVPDTRLTTMQPDTRLAGRLTDFGLDAASRSAIVTYDATVMRTGSEAIEAKRFSARVPVASEDPQTVGVAIDQAANQVAGEVADWIGTR